MHSYKVVVQFRPRLSALQCDNTMADMKKLPQNVIGINLPTCLTRRITILQHPSFQPEDGSKAYTEAAAAQFEEKAEAHL
jgi:hypothetical protein